MKRQLLGILLALSALAVSTPAHAFNLTAFGGLNLKGGDAFLNYKSSGFNYGGEVTFDLTVLELGAFYQHYGVSPDLAGTSSDGVNRFGAVGRLSLGEGPFVDVRLGLDKFSNGNVSGVTYDSTFAWGVGLGWKFKLAPTFSLSPRVGFNGVTVKQSGGTGSSLSVSGTLVDADLLLTFSL